MPRTGKRKRMGFVGTPAWKKRKVGESSSSCTSSQISLPCGQGTPELFNSNQSEETSDSASTSAHVPSASYRKIYGAKGGDSDDSENEDDFEGDVSGTDHELDNETEDKDSDANPIGYRIIDMEFLTMAISHTRCEQCKSGKLSLTEDETQRAGLMSSLYIQCNDCKHMIHVPTSKKRVPRGMSYEINRRSVYAAASLGLGHKGLSQFCAFMNMPPPIHHDSYQMHLKQISQASVDLAAENMKSAVKCVKTKLKDGGDVSDDENDCDDETCVDIGVSCDGSWHRRGFSSLVGTTAVISLETGQVLDYEILNKICYECRHWKNIPESDPKRDNWSQKHVQICPMNYSGSAPGMEAVGACRIWQRSEEKNKLRYTTFLGDGDSKSFSSVSQVSSYPVSKIDCVGHVQKRLGTRLRNLVKKEKFADGSRLGGKGKLTKARIDSMQNYFGQAIRLHSHDLDGMQTAVKAILYHSVDNENREEQHQYCPKGKDSWCKFQKDKVNGTNTYKSDNCLSANFLSKLKPTFDDLSSTDLLSRCLDGYTQNTNESLHGMIWSRCPKTKSFGMQQVQFAVSSAVCEFNSGAKFHTSLLELMDVPPGTYTTLYCAELDKQRVYHSERKSKDRFRKRRKQLRRQRKGIQDTHVQAEGTTYESGQF